MIWNQQVGSLEVVMNLSNCVYYQVIWFAPQVYILLVYTSINLSDTHLNFAGWLDPTQAQTGGQFTELDLKFNNALLIPIL